MNKYNFKYLSLQNNHKLSFSEILRVNVLYCNGIYGALVSCKTIFSEFSVLKGSPGHLLSTEQPFLKNQNIRA